MSTEKDSPFKFLPYAQAAMSIYGMFSANKAAKRQLREARAAQEQQLKFQKEQSLILEQDKKAYREIEFTNPYAGMQNTYEDMPVATGAANFQAQQGAQQRADILGQLRGSAGGSGIAGLAQSLANQGQLQTQRIAANLQEQEARNALYGAKGASEVQQFKASGDTMVQQAESGRQATLLSTQYGASAGANTSYQQSMLNTQNAMTSGDQMRSNAISNLTTTLTNDSVAEKLQELFTSS
jgi:hypothetical protein